VGVESGRDPWNLLRATCGCENVDRSAVMHRRRNEVLTLAPLGCESSSTYSSQHGVPTRIGRSEWAKDGSVARAVRRAGLGSGDGGITPVVGRCCAAGHLEAHDPN